MTWLEVGDNPHCVEVGTHLDLSCQDKLKKLILSIFLFI